LLDKEKANACASPTNPLPIIPTVIVKKIFYFHLI
jgi:hypothetical protein